MTAGTSPLFPPALIHFLKKHASKQCPAEQQAYAECVRGRSISVVRLSPPQLSRDVEVVARLMRDGPPQTGVGVQRSGGGHELVSTVRSHTIAWRPPASKTRSDLVAAGLLAADARITNIPPTLPLVRAAPAVNSRIRRPRTP